MNPLKAFWKWYDDHIVLNTAVAAFLFGLQVIHLYWLATDVIMMKLTGHTFFHLEGFFYYLILLVDYTEIPALITTSLVYINDLRKNGYSFKSVLFIFLLLSQFLHIFWITDEFVVEQFAGTLKETVLPLWIAWVAILIDYLEVPVIIDTFKKLFVAIKHSNLKEASEAIKEKN